MAVSSLTAVQDIIIRYTSHHITHRTKLGAVADCIVARKFPAQSAVRVAMMGFTYRDLASTPTLITARIKLYDLKRRAVEASASGARYYASQRDQ